MSGNGDSMDAQSLQAHQELIAEMHKGIGERFSEYYHLLGSVNGPSPSPAQEALVLVKHMQPGQREQMAFAHRHLAAWVRKELDGRGTCGADFMMIVDGLAWCFINDDYKWEDGEWVGRKEVANAQ